MPVAGQVGLSADSWVAWTEEVTGGWGSGVGTDLDSNSGFSLFTRETITANLDVQVPPNIASAHRDSNQVYLARETVSGDLEIPVAYEGLETLWLHAMGSTSASGPTSGVYTTTFDLSSTGRYRNASSAGLVLHVARGAVFSGTDPTVFSYNGMVVDQLQLRNPGPSDALLMTLTFFGKQQTFAVDTQSPIFPTAPVAVGKQCAVTWQRGPGTDDDIEFFASDFTLTMRRGIDQNRFRLGSTTSEEPPMSQYEIEATVTAEWDGEGRGGDPGTAMIADYANQTVGELKFTYTGGTITGTSQSYSLTITVPKAFISQYPINVTAAGRVTVPITFTGYTDDTTTTPHELRIVTVNEANFSE